MTSPPPLIVTSRSAPTQSLKTQSSPTSCALTTALVVEVSDPGSVGVVTVPLGPDTSQAIQVLAEQVLSLDEQSVVAVVVAHTSANTSAVSADFAGGGSDEMAVVDGWAVLLDKLAAPSGSASGPVSAGSSQSTSTTSSTSPPAADAQATVDALSRNGKLLEQAQSPGSGTLAMAVQACATPAKPTPSG